MTAKPQPSNIGAIHRRSEKTLLKFLVQRSESCQYFSTSSTTFSQMIYSCSVIGLLLSVLSKSCDGLQTSPSFLRRSTLLLKAVPEWTTGDGIPVEEEFEVPMVTVRFINTLGGKDIVTVVEQGSNLLFVGDQAGVKLPRSCRTGLCASCTCEVQDPLAIATASNPRDGFATIRACSTKCFVPGGMDEMVVDVYRMQNRAPIKSRGDVSNAGVAAVAFEAYSNPMARFDDNWEKEFKPSWETTVTTNTARSGNPTESRVCSNCNGTGKVECYGCNGTGEVQMGSPSGLKIVQCQLCVGKCTAGCGSCRGMGTAYKMKQY